MRRWVCAGILAVAVLLLPACTDAREGESGPTASSTPPPSITAEPVPSSTAVTPGDPADPATWIVSDKGMGPLVIGMPFPEAIAILPRAEDACGHAYTGADGSAWIVRSGDLMDGPLDVVMWHGAPGPQTAEGIGIGSSVEDVRAAYPEAAEVAGQADHLQAGRIYFAVGSGAVTEIGVTATEVPWEFCG
ncbi:MAG: hypothetical protein ABWY55_05475 [Microbacterium sp.]